ncbi:ferredoxin [Nocardiopsis sediminis]|uniref:Ferredoxin n=1 Tax=Nocardiopsis sediminis TaxID=1778267 RepID=A0ABV8FJT2_9ACTN
MRVEVDEHRCVASGQCVLIAPEVFDQRDEDGTVVLLESAPAPDRRAGAREAAMLCPASAIRALQG